MKYALTWTESATYRTEINITNEQLAHFINTTGLLRHTKHLNNPTATITESDIIAMQSTNPHFHRTLINLYIDHHHILTPTNSHILAAAGQKITTINTAHT